MAEPPDDVDVDLPAVLGGAVRRSDRPPERASLPEFGEASLSLPHPPALPAPPPSVPELDLQRGYSQLATAPTASGRPISRRPPAGAAGSAAPSLRPSVPPRSPSLNPGPAQSPSFGPTSGRSPSLSPGSGIGLAPSSGLDIDYRRPAARRAAAASDDAYDATTGERIVSLAVAGVSAVAAGAALAKLFHHHGGHSLASLAPHAFDARSPVQSGIFALATLAFAVGVGFNGARTQPRSWAMVVSAVLLVVTSLAMITVVLVAMDPEPSPADGALLVPWVVPIALLLFAVGLVGRGAYLFREGGAVRRALAVVVGLAAGAIAFAAVEGGAFARFFP